MTSEGGSILDADYPQSGSLLHADQHLYYGSLFGYFFIIRICGLIEGSTAFVVMNINNHQAVLSAVYYC